MKCFKYEEEYQDVGKTKKVSHKNTPLSVVESHLLGLEVSECNERFMIL